MADTVFNSLKGNYESAMGLLNQFIEVCPDEIWVEKFGGWPVWQQVYHALMTIDFFVMDKGGQPSPAPLPQGVASFGEPPAQALTRAQMRDQAKVMQATAAAYLSGLASAPDGPDSRLGEVHDSLSARLSAYGLPPVTHAGLIAMMGSHAMYHLGSCDAALRQHGLKGVY